MNIFEQAVKQGLRFNTSKGLISVEDVYKLPLDRGVLNLDVLAQDLNQAIKDSGQESFVRETPSINKELSLKFEIVKHIIKVKLEERDAVKAAKDRKHEREELDNLIAQKQQDAKKDLPLEELIKLREKLS